MVNKSSKGQDLLLTALQELSQYDFKIFKDKLSRIDFEDQRNIPWSQLEKADHIEAKNLMTNSYGAENALDVAFEVFNKIHLLGPASLLKEERERAFQPYRPYEISDAETAFQPYRPYEISDAETDYRKKYMNCIKERNILIKDRNACFGDMVYLQKRYTKLLIVKLPRPRHERELEIRSSGKEHSKIFHKLAQSMSYPDTNSLLQSSEDGGRPMTIVLLGPAGIGKTMTVKKIMLDWVSGNLYLERFDYIFYISCREINQISEQSVSDMISAGCPDRTLPQSVLREKPDKLLIIVDGFDELAFSLGLSEDEICRDPFKKQPVAITLINLLRKNILSTCSIILTTRPVAMSQLREYLITARYAEIIGFTEEDRRIYFNNFFDNNSQASLALTVVKDNDILYTMCCFPIVCWSICTLMKEQLIQGNNVLYTSPSTTTTAVYLSLLSILLRDHSKASLMDMDMHKCLKRLCSLALDGIFKQNTLFTEDDVKHYDLTFPGIRYLFLSQMDFKVGIDHINTYSFIHLSFQNFFAALFFLLDVDVDTNNNSTFPERNVNQFLKTYSESDGTHLMSTVLFMFGLINSDRRSHMEEHLSMKVSERARNDLLVWIKEPKNVLPGLDAFYILYEIHDEDVVNTAMKHAKKEISITEMMRMIDMDYRVLYFYFQKSGYSKLLWKCFLLMCIYFHAKFSSTRAASHELWIKIRPIIKCCC